jgi:hypothetical protein
LAAVRSLTKARAGFGLHKGSSSAVLDFDTPDLESFPRLAAVRGAREVRVCVCVSPPI